MELLTVAEAARFLRVMPQTLYSWAHYRMIPHQKVGHSLRFEKHALARWLKPQRRAARSRKPLARAQK